MAMREEMVLNGLKFLQHPNVQTTPLSERVSFLEQKGMTKEEIQEAIERHQNGEIAGSAPPPPMKMQSAAPGVMAAAPMVMAAAAPVQQLIRKSRYPPYVRMLWTISSLVGAASILGFLWHMAVRSGYFPWLYRSPPLLEASKVAEEEKENAEKEEVLMQGLNEISSTIQAQTAELAKLCAALDTSEQDLRTQSAISTQVAASLAEQSTSQAIADLKAEVSTLKTLLLAKTEESSAKAQSKSESLAAETSDVKPVGVKSIPTATSHVPSVAKVSNAERMQKALKMLRTENSMEQIKLAAGILSMYVKNLVENPDVPRYRRIAPGNANFKQKIEPLKHHDELLKSIGFVAAGLNMEWKWHTADRTNGEFDENIAILRALLEALQSVSKPSASSNLSLEEIAQKSMEDFHAKRTENDKPESSEPMEPAKANVGANTKTTDLNSFMAKLEESAKAESAATKQKTDSSTVESTDSVLAAATAVNQADDQSSSVANDSNSASGPSYPKSFTEVMEMLKKGEEIPGIQEIEDKVSVDSAKYLSTPSATSSVQDDVVGVVAGAPKKPWEQLSG